MNGKTSELIAVIPLVILASIPVLLAQYVTCLFILRERASVRTLAIQCSLFLCCMWSGRLLIDYSAMAGYVLVSIYSFGIVRLLYHQKGNKWLYLSLEIICSFVAVEAVFLVILLLLRSLHVDIQTFDLVYTRNAFDIRKVSMNCLVTAFSQTIVLLLWKAGHWFKEKKGRQKIYMKLAVHFVCQAILSTGGMIITVNFIMNKDPLTFLGLSAEAKYMLCIIWNLAFLFTLMTGFLHDIQYIRQLQRNDTLEQQRAISDSLLINLRYFRHNMINMLYGFEGMILSGELQKIKEYYRDITAKCALINNENIAALERISNPALNSLLLRALNRAREIDLPMNLYVQPKVMVSRRIKASDLCQVLGVLLDNAIEAASQAQERFVSVEIRNLNNVTEIIIKNTYTGKIQQSDLYSGMRSTKPGHTGEGLRSCHEIIQKSRRLHLNFFVTDQYVSAQLLLDT